MGLDDQAQTIYTVFGLLDDEEATVRVDEHAPEDALPENEQHEGVHLIELKLYGDSTNKGLLIVDGTDLEHVTEAYQRVRDAGKALLAAAWTPAKNHELGVAIDVDPRYSGSRQGDEKAPPNAP